MLSFTSIVHNVLATIFRLGGEWIKDATFIRAAGFNSATGLTTATEQMASCKALCLGYRPMELALSAIQPGDEKILIRASELTGIPSPGEGDQILETATQVLRNVMAARLDVTGEYWLFQAARSLGLDWGDLSAASSFEDWGNLTAATSSEDWGTLF